MVHFLYGDYGTGKSTYILNKIKTDYLNGVRSFLIVPEQNTVICEKNVATMLPAMAQLYTEATNFTRLSNKVFRELGGLKYNYISKSGKNLIMYRAICECRGRLREFKIAEGHEKGAIKLFLEAIGELKSYNITMGALEKATTELENEQLKGRIFDIITVWSVYESILTERFSDPYDDITMLAEKLQSSNYFKGTNVYIDAFYGFTDSQFEVIEKIIGSADNVTFAFDCPANATEKTIQFAKIAKNAKRSVALAKRLGKEISSMSFDTDYKHTTNDMKLLCSKLWDFTSRGYQSDGSITLAKCSDEFDECEYVSSEICRLVRQGYKYSDIAIVARNTDTYRGILDYTLKKYQIPHFMSSSSEWLTRPLVKMIFSALNFISSYRQDDILSFAKSPYIDIDSTSLANFERYIIQWDIFGKKFKLDEYWAANPDGFVKEETESQRKALESVLSARNFLLEKISVLEKPFLANGTVKDCAVAVYEFLKCNDIISKLEVERKQSDKAEAYIISQAWEGILEALDTLVDICGQIKVDANTFTTLLNYAFMDATVGSIPTGEDNVLIADAHLVRAENVRHVFVLGANEGSFPANVVGGSIFSDSDKIALETVSINLSDKSDVRADDELLFFKNALAIASEGAHICALSTGIDGKGKQESIGYKRIKELFVNIKPIDTSKINEIDKIYTPDLAREYYSTCDSALCQAITNELSYEGNGRYDFSNDNDSLSEQAVSSVFGDFLKLSQTQMELFNTCKFKYYSSQFLKLRSEKRYFFSSLEAGTLVHDVFEHFLAILNNNKDDFSLLDEKAIKESVDAIIDDYIKLICHGLKISNKLKHLFERLKKNLYIFVAKLVEEFKASGFTPEYLELPFKHGVEGVAEPLVFELENGKRACVDGIADRVDVCRRDNKTYIRVADYKIGSKNFSESEISNGGSLQLLIYLFSLCKMKDCDFRRKLLKDTEEIVPAGFFYIPLNIGKLTTSDDFSDDIVLSERTETSHLEKASAFRGKFLDDASIITLQDKCPGGKFLPSTDSKVKRHYYISLEKFEELYEKMHDSIVAIGNEMYSGNACADAETTGNKNPCKYCELQAFCRRGDK
ncbi:MAG: PD-(D/E)XK nuclease family protein [Clostridia bacterium]|nr:PD-(D/E)XK nuclease family protein [Clostridia bacterium]